MKDDGLNFFRGLLVAIPLAVLMWLGIWCLIKLF